MIKKIFIVITLFWITSSLFSQNREFTLNVQLSDSERNGQTAYLKKLNYNNLSDATLLNSTTVTNGKFSFKGAAPARPEMYIIEIAKGKNDKENFTGFFVAEAGTVTMDVSESITVKGAVENTKHEELQQKLAGFFSEFANLQKQAQTLSSSGQLTQDMLNVMSMTANNITSDMNKAVYAYTKENIKNGTGEFYFINYASQFSIDQLNELYSHAKSEFGEAEVVKDLMQKLVWAQEDIKEGKILSGIELPNIDGKIENFEKHIGKGDVVLVDFWASWCGPCRKEMPELALLHKRYKDQGFVIIGISLDELEKDWKGAVKAMNMVWPQYSDLKGWEGVAARTYGVTRIPQSFLLDKKGTIIAHNLKGVQLENKIKELLKK